ncbi:ArsB/NhaD family transporter, partial [Helicobacter typhlonius]
FTFICAFLAIVYGKILRKMQFFASLKDAPFGIVFFSLGLFIVVYGLKNGGILSFLTEALPLFASFSKQVQILCLGFASSIGSSVMNNLPMVMLGNLALADLRMQLETFNALIFAHLLGCNIGAKLTPIGSLATLLWLSRLKAYGIQLGFLRYMVAAFLITLPLLLLGLCGLICWEYFA